MRRTKQRLVRGSTSNSSGPKGSVPGNRLRHMEGGMRKRKKSKKCAGTSCSGRRRQGGQKLTEMQRRFVDEYLVDLNATQAAIRAGYSPKAARQQGSRLLTNAAIAEAICNGHEARNNRTLIDQDTVVQETRSCWVFSHYRLCGMGSTKRRQTQGQCDD